MPLCWYKFGAVAAAIPNFVPPRRGDEPSAPAPEPRTPCPLSFTTGRRASSPSAVRYWRTAGEPFSPSVSPFRIKCPEKSVLPIQHRAFAMFATVFVVNVLPFHNRMTNVTNLHVSPIRSSVRPPCRAHLLDLAFACRSARPVYSLCDSSPRLVHVSFCLPVSHSAHSDRGMFSHRLKRVFYASKTTRDVLLLFKGTRAL